MLSTVRVDWHGEFSEDGCRWVRYAGRVTCFQCRRNNQIATHRQQAFFNVPEVKQLWMMLTFLMPPSPQSTSMLPQQHRHLDNCSTSSVDKKPWHFKLPVPISDLTHHLWCTAMEHGQWISCFQSHFMSHVMCIVNMPGGASIQKWPSPYFGANSNASVLTFSRHFDDAREFMEFELVHSCSEKPVNKWIKKVNCV